MAIIWSRKLWPASAVTRTTSQSESTVVPPVTAERSPPDSRMTGADSPVMALSSTDAAPIDDLAVGGDLLACRHVEQVLLLQNRRTHLVGLQAEELSRIVHVMALRHQALVELVRGHIALGGAQRVGLRLAAALGERLREVREQHREPEHRRDGK